MTAHEVLEMQRLTNKFVAPMVAACALGLGISLAGCASTTTEGANDEALTLYEPAEQTLVRGSTNKILVMVDRDNIDGDLAVEILDLPSGVEVVEDNPRIPAGDRSATLTLHAAEDAELASGHPVRIEVSTENGLRVAEWVEIDVVAQK